MDEYDLENEFNADGNYEFGLNVTHKDVNYTTPSYEDQTIDYADQDFPNTIWYNKGNQEIFFSLGIFLPVCTIGLIGNFLVLYVLKSNKHIRNPTNLIIGNMAIADLLSLIVHPCFIFVYDYYQNYQLGEIGCKGEGPVECTILLASVISMSAITYDRLTAIVLPNETRINKKTAKIIISLTWLIGMFLSIPLAVFRKFKERDWKNFTEKYCTEQAVVVNIYWYVIITVLVWLPLSIQIICYSAIFVKLNKYEKIIVKSLNNHQMGYKRSAAKMMFIVILTFMICRLPFTAFIIYRHQRLKSSNVSAASDITNIVNGLYHTLWLSSKYLLIANAAINPMIYSVTNVAFRNAFKKTKLFRWLCSAANKPSVKKANTKQQKPPQPTSSEETKNRRKIFYIFRNMQCTKSTEGRDSSTKCEIIYNTKL